MQNAETHTFPDRLTLALDLFNRLKDLSMNYARMIFTAASLLVLAACDSNDNDSPPANLPALNTTVQEHNRAGAARVPRRSGR
jgi:hypothetical protein